MWCEIGGLDGLGLRRVSAGASALALQELSVALDYSLRTISSAACTRVRARSKASLSASGQLIL